MRIKGKKDYMVALESVAMTDIVLTMFIFFFISFSLIYTFNPTRLSMIDVKLPKASSAISIEGSEKIILTVSEKGEYFINDEKTGASSLKNDLLERLKENPGIGIILKVDGMTDFKDVVTALDIINELNIQKVSVAAIKSEV